MRTPLRKILAITLAAGACFFVGRDVLSDISGHEVCLRCGATREMTVYRLPGTEITWETSSSPTETIFSRFVTSQDLVSSHEHDWCLSHGGSGLLLFKTTLSGRAMYVDHAVKKEEPVSLLEALTQRGLLVERDEILNATLSPSRTRPALDIAYTFASAAPSNDEEFGRWMEEYQDYWERMRNPDDF